MRDREVLDNAGAVHRRDLARLLRFVVAIAVVVVLVLVGLDNRDEVRVGYVVDSAQMPVWVVVVGAAVAGMVIAALVRGSRRSA